MRKIIKKLGDIIIICLFTLALVSVKANCAVSNSFVSSSGDSNDIKVIIGIVILSLITALVTLRRAISAKRNN